MNDLSCCGVDVVGEMPDGAVPMEAIAVVKYVGEDGVANLQVVMSPKLATWEVVGMVDFLSRVTQRAIAEA